MLTKIFKMCLSCLIIFHTLKNLTAYIVDNKSAKRKNINSLFRVKLKIYYKQASLFRFTRI